MRLLGVILCLGAALLLSPANVRADAPLTVTTASLANGQIGVAYTQTLAATGGTAPYSWQLTAGGLPIGLTLNASTGLISGTPTAATTASLTFKVTDSGSPAQAVTVTFTLAVTSAILLPVNVTVAPGQCASFAVALATPAGPGDVSVTLSSSDPSTVSLALSPQNSFVVVIPAGATVPDRRTPNALVCGVKFGSALINAAAKGYPSAGQTVRVFETLSFFPSNVIEPNLAKQVRLTLSETYPALAGGLMVSLSSDNPAVGTVPPTVTIPAGATSVSVPVTGVSAGTTLIHASGAPNAGDAVASVTFVTGGTPALLSIAPNTGVPGQSGNTPATGHSILILTGNGTSSLNGPLAAAGFTVINGTLGPGQIAAKLTPDVACVYVWNDGSLGNSGSPANPSLAFNAADQAALVAFSATHPQFILDGLSWRGNQVPDEVAFSQNEALQLVKAGGGIVLGADDASGALIVQHVNQVGGWFNLNPFAGVYTTLPAIQQFGGSLFTSPHSVDPAKMTSSTTTYSEVPHGLQPNGIFLATALFGSPSGPTPGNGSASLPNDIFNGVTYTSVNHVMTTSIGGGGIDNATTVQVLITGQYTHFTSASVIDLGQGITIANVVATDATHLTADVAIAANAPVGSRTLTVTSGTEVVSLANAFTVIGAPALVSITPNNAAQGQQNLSVAITGQFTHFTNASTIDLGAGITIGSVLATDATHLTALATIAANATIGSRSLTVTSGTEVVTMVNAFTVIGLPVITQVNPSTGQQGQTNLSVTITGQSTHWVQGTTTANFGAGITVGSLVVTSVTSATAVLNIDLAAAIGARNVTVTTGAEVVTLPNAFTVTPLVLVPSITTVSPTAAQQGQGGPMTIVGLNTHFVQGTSVLDLGPGITVTGVTVTCSTCISAQVAITDTAATGARNVTVTTGAEVATLVNGFTVQPGNPILTSLVPASGRQGQSFLVTMTGKFTHWVQGTTQLSFGTGVSVSTVTVSSATSLTAQLTIDAAASLGTRTPTVTTGTEVVSVPDIFTVQSGLTSVTPAPVSGKQAQTTTVTITGQFTHFAQGTSAVSFGADITVGTVTVASGTSLTAQITIAEKAAIGPRTVTVTTGTEIVAAPNAFTVNLGTVLLSLNPGGAYQNQTVSVAITGQLTNFVQGTTQATFGAGISVGGAAEGGFGPVTVTGPTAATAQIVVNPAATPGLRTVCAKTGGETACFTNGFSVLAPFVISSITPNSAVLGQQNLTVAVVGQNTHFVQNVSVLDLAGAGVTINSLTVTDATHLTAVISVASNATVAVRDVAVTTGSEFALLKAGFTVTGLPSILSITPNNGQQGQTNLPVTIVGQNTHFTNASIIDLGAGITVSGVSATDVTHLSAKLTIAANATTGLRTLTVTTGTEVATLVNAFGVNVGVNQAPVITIAPTWAVTLPSRLTITYTVTDDGLPSGGALTVSWETISGPGNVGFQSQTPTSISVGFDQPGTYVLRITATDTLLTVHQDVTVTVTGNAVPPPTVSITSPTEGMEVTAPVNVVGTVTSAALASWTLEMRMQEESVFRPFATGTAQVTNGVLGSFDPTLLLNGIALIQLRATDTGGQTSIAGAVSVVLTKNLKIGNFTVSFNDLSVPVAGLPIQVVRTYDSRNKTIGDFGVGWTLDLKTVRLTTNGALGDNWTETRSGGAFPTYCLQAVKTHVVTVSFNDGTTYEFQPALNPQCQQLIPIQDQNVAMTFTPTGITPPNATLAVLGGTQPFVTGSVPGPVLLIDENTLGSFDPDRYLLTLPDGRVLQISRAAGLQTMTDLNGNKLTVTSSGITHSSGKSVSFQRDISGRITQITDPAGNPIVYTYDLNGNLASVKDRENNTTTFTYDGNHGLLTILDPRGVQPIKNVYDSSGRLIQHIDAFGKVINYTHDLADHQEIITDRLGNVTVNNYDTAGNIVKVTDALGGITTRTYDASGNLTSETNALNKKRTYTYDQNNNRKTETDPLGNTTTYSYNSRNQVLTVTDALNRMTINVYDGNGNLTSTKDPAGFTTAYLYNGQGLRTQMTDALGDVTSYLYDGSGNLTKLTDALSHVTNYVYDGNGNKTSETTTRTTPSGPETLLTSYLYDKQNRLTQTTYPDGSITKIQYNNIGKQSVTTDQLGRQTSYQYDLMGRLTQTNYPDGTSESSAYDAEGNRVMSTDRASRTTSYLYDQLNRLKKTTYPDNSSTSTIYDAAGQVVSVSDALGNVTQYQYDDAGRRNRITDALGHATSFIYDVVGNESQMTDANGNITQYLYDPDNRRTKVIYADTTADTTTYDGLGRTTSKTDQAGKMTQFGYDKLGRLTQVTDALNQLTKYSYDEVGNRISQTDANGHTTTFGYDQLGRRTKRTLPLGMAETLVYDAAGNLTKKTDFNGKITIYQYDAANRLTNKIPDSSFTAPQVVFTYTMTGQRQSMVDSSGTTSYAYDQRDRLKQKATPQGTLTYTYDLAGNLATVRSSNTGGTSVDYSYDQLNRLSSARDNRLASGTTMYQYDNAGNLQNYTYPNGVQSVYQYDALNRLKNLALSKGATLASYAYQLGLAGNRTQVTELGGRQVAYDYDNLYRLTKETISGATVNGVIGYQYDFVGNRSQRTSTVAPVPPASYSYDFNDRLTTDTYDSDGNTTVSGGNTYTYDFENHLLNLNGGTTSILYDGDGNRVAKTTGGATTRYLVDDRNLTGYAQVLEEIVGGAVQRVYTYGLNRISQSQASGTSFYGYDGHGNVRLLTDATGAVTDRYDYDAFGNIISQTGTTPNVYLYSGEQSDPNLGFYYLRARYYNSVSGRFTVMDTAPPYSFDPRDAHLYNYVAGDPVNRWDPSGHAGIATNLSEVGLVVAVWTQLLVNTYPNLATALGVAVSVVLPEDLNNALLAAGNPFAEIGNEARVIEGEAVSIYKVLKSPAAKNLIQRDASAAGTLWRTLGHEFEDYVFKRLFPGAAREILSGSGERVADGLWRSFVIEVKTSNALGGREIAQLASLEGLARSNGLKLVYVFLDEPVEATKALLKGVGAAAIWFQ